MDSACLKEIATHILSDSDHSTKVAPTTLIIFLAPFGAQKSGKGLYMGAAYTRNNTEDNIVYQRIVF